MTVLWRPTFFHWLLRGYVAYYAVERTELCIVTIKSHKNTELHTRTQSASRTERMMSPQREATQIRKQRGQYTKSYHTPGKPRAQKYVRFQESRWYRVCACFFEEFSSTFFSRAFQAPLKSKIKFEGFWRSTRGDTSLAFCLPDVPFTTMPFFRPNDRNTKGDYQWLAVFARFDWIS